MKWRAGGTRKMFAGLCVLLTVGISIVLANDPNGPVLTKAWLEKPEIDEAIGHARLGGAIFRASGLLSLSVTDADRDLLGIRIKERYVLPNGATSSFEESYHVFAHGASRSFPYRSRDSRHVPVYFRRENRVKDEPQWQVFLDRVERGETTRETQIPPVYITMPEPNTVEVFVSVYDMKGHESEMVPVSRPKSVPKELEERWAANARRREAKKYDTRATDFARWPEGDERLRPDNAALLYLRATACLPEPPDPCTTRLINLMFEGREPDDRVKAYLNEGLDAISLMQLGSQIPHCDFGLSCGPHVDTGGTWASINGLPLLMGKHIRTLKAEGYYRVALENCLVERRLAAHLGDATHWHSIFSGSIDLVALYAIVDVLQDMPTDVETFRWLCEQLGTSKGAIWRPAEAIRNWRDSELLSWEFNKGDHRFERSWAIERLQEEWRRYEAMDLNIDPGRVFLPDEAKRKEILALSDEQIQVWMLFEQRARPGCRYGLALSDELRAKACQAYDAYAESFVEVMTDSAPYEQKRERLAKIDEWFYEQGNLHKPISLFSFCSTVGTVGRLSALKAMGQNLVTVALEIRMIAAETGQVPQSLPGGLPKNPFTGEDFQYEPTEDGFILRIDSEAINEWRREYRFKIRSL